MIWTIAVGGVLLLVLVRLLLALSDRIAVTKDIEERTSRRIETISAEVLDARAKLIASTLSKRRLDALEKRIAKIETKLKNQTKQ